MYGHIETEQARLARNQLYASVAEIDARLYSLLGALFALIREFAKHPHGGDPRGIHAKHENERKAENAKMTEIAFVVLAALLGGIFIWLGVETPLPPLLALLLIIAFMFVFSWAATIALRRGITWTLDVQIKEDKEDTDRAEARARIAFAICFVIFLVCLVCFTLGRYAAIGGPEFVGISQTMTEIFALLCAAIAGAMHNFYLSIVSLVRRIQKAFREVSLLRSEKLALGGDVEQVDRLLQSATDGPTMNTPPAPSSAAKLPE
jgi:membrane protein YdbS with pleckstrin-like domain